MEETRFACDAMLGTLARWLRFAGIDAFFEAGIDDDELASLARAEGRWLLTQDRGLAARAGPRSMLVRRGDLADQIADLRARLPLEIRPERFFTRCSTCNTVLSEVSRDQVTARVPPFVVANASRFRECPSCGRVYWPGSHEPRIRRRLDELFGPFTDA